MYLKLSINPSFSRSLFTKLDQWSRDLTWPWDLDETLMGVRYFTTGLLLFLAFLSLVFAFFGSGEVEHEVDSNPELKA